ncbi:hypothetical protein VNO78_15775 [Psophocarpus tetragonolobus]|uniref:Uncharacterized protein n=1 Tax=Psophocarpus tetragonolobus TaxID=3891 RepID=A0AAN9SFK9_PSOTE
MQCNALLLSLHFLSSLCKRKKALERGKNSESDAEEPPKTSKKRKAQAELKSLAPSRKPKGSRHKRLKVEAKIRSHSPPASKDAEDISTPETEIFATEGNSQINLVEEEIPSNTPMTQKNIEIVKISSSHRPNSKPEVQKEIVNVFNVESSLRCLEDEHENTGQEELECSLNGNGCSPSKEIPEFVSNHPSTPTLTYNPEELKDLLNQVETDPFKMLKLFPGGTCMFSGPSKSSDENFNVALDEFRHLAFTGSLYRNLENPEYKRKVEAVSKRVVDFPQGRTPEMQNKVKVFMDLFNKAYSFYNSQQVMCDQFTQIINQRDADFNKLKTVNDQFNKIEETMNNRRLVIDEGKHQEEDIEEKINKLWDKLSKAKKERASLEVDQHKSDTAKNDCEQIAKQLSVNIVKSIEKECELKTTKDQHARDIIALEESYQQMQANPPF